MGNSWGTYNPKHCLFSQNFGITTLRQQIIENTVIAVFMRLQGILHTKFYPATFAYESKGRRFESCRGHHCNADTASICGVFYFVGNKCQFDTGNIWGRFLNFTIIESYLKNNTCHNIALTSSYPGTNIIFDRKTYHAYNTIFRSAYTNFPKFCFINYRHRNIQISSACLV